MDEIFCLRGNMYSFKCGDESKNNLKGISKFKRKKIKFEDFKKMFRC